MRMTDVGRRAPVARTDAQADADDGADWATQTRRVLTRDLLLRAARAQPGESRALQFRALYLNLPVIGEVADRLGLTDAERSRVEHAALDGLAQAIRLYDPCGDDDFVAVARPLIEREIAAERAVPLPSRRHLQQAVRRLAVALAGSRV
jgi:hypothetical protein